ncbi:MAG: sigma-54 dependent transcriptional regulator [Pseudomonadota bacterium]
MSQPCLLVVDDEPNALFGITQLLKDEGYKVVPASSGREALELLEKNTISLVITDQKMPGLSGLDLLYEIKKLDQDIPVILLTGYGSVNMAVEALKQGAYYFFEKPIFNSLDKFLTIIGQALKTQELEKELSQLRKEVSEKYSFPNVIGQGQKMLEIFEFIGRVAQTDKTVLIQGESGTGKDLIAKTLHYNSPRKKKPFISVNCGALTDTLLASELFGHTKGSFTGAIKDTVGRFQAADGGTLVLEEIGEVPLQSQKVLLRVLETKMLERVGSSQSIEVDVRIIVTTNRNLREEVTNGNFRKDLYYRLNILSVTVPPLRERVSDIPLLANYFLKIYQEGDIPFRIKPEVMVFFKTYAWPGNVRELSNVIQHMITFCRGNIITMKDLPSYLLANEEDVQEMESGGINLTKMVSDLEKKMDCEEAGGRKLESTKSNRIAWCHQEDAGQPN